MTMMARVTKANRCPICNGDTWCLVGRSVIICMRTVSPRTKNFKGGEVGYIHLHPDPNKKLAYEPRPAKKLPQINAKRVLADWARAFDLAQSRLPYLAQDLGVTVESLKALECQTNGNPRTWGFPMKDGYGNYIGIRLRNEWGKKWAVLGSQAGIFIPNVPYQARVFIVEGPTDTAAAVSLGLYAIGRPSCSGGVTHLVDWIKRCHASEAVIVSDNDDPGIRGAAELQRWLKVPSCVMLLPTKDLREFIKFGDRPTIDSMIEQVVWTQPKETCQ